MCRLESSGSNHAHGFERLGEFNRDAMTTVMLVDSPDYAAGRCRKNVVVPVEESDSTVTGDGAVKNTGRDVQPHSTKADVPHERLGWRQAANAELGAEPPHRLESRVAARRPRPRRWRGLAHISGRRHRGGRARRHPLLQLLEPVENDVDLSRDLRRSRPDDHEPPVRVRSPHRARQNPGMSPRRPALDSAACGTPPGPISSRLR